MKEVSCDNYRFTFANAMEAFVFDEQDKSSPYFHGLSHCLKAVDIIVEHQHRYYFIELKSCVDKKRAHQLSNPKQQQHKFQDFKSAFIQKYKDTLLYRVAELKFDKPIYYICLLNLEPALLLQMEKQLKELLPIGIRKETPRWQKSLVEQVIVVNENLWNQSFKEYGFSM